MIKIDKNMPIPDGAYNTGNMHNSKYPWHLMEVGDSFLAKDRKPTQMSVPPGIKKTGARFVKRTVEGGTRVWRIK